MSDLPASPEAPDLATARDLSHFFGSGDTRTRILADITIAIPPASSSS